MILWKCEDVFKHKIFLHEKVVYQLDLMIWYMFFRLTLGFFTEIVFSIFNICELTLAYLRSYELFMNSIACFYTRYKDFIEEEWLVKEAEMAKLRLRLFELLKVSVRRTCRNISYFLLKQRIVKKLNHAIH